jgi:hypothetical protein
MRYTIFSGVNFLQQQADLGAVGAGNPVDSVILNKIPWTTFALRQIAPCS